MKKGVNIIDNLEQISEKNCKYYKINQEQINKKSCEYYKIN